MCLSTILSTTSGKLGFSVAWVEISILVMLSESFVRWTMTAGSLVLFCFSDFLSLWVFEAQRRNNLAKSPERRNFIKKPRRVLENILRKGTINFDAGREATQENYTTVRIDSPGFSSTLTVCIRIILRIKPAHNWSEVSVNVGTPLTITRPFSMYVLTSFETFFLSYMELYLGEP